MVPMKRNLKFLTLGTALLFLISMAACSGNLATGGLSDADALATSQAANPLPTQISGQGLKVSASNACLVKEEVSISTDTDQGDLLAWSPTQDELAYVRPANGRWAWFVGDLVVYDIDLDKEMYVSIDQEVFGDLTWGPDATALAYIVLDSDQRTYTVLVLDMATGTDLDIFASSSAQTDDWSSTKGITNWVSERNVVVTSSCGLDCARIYNYNTETGVLTIDGEERKNEDPSLTLTNEMISPGGTWTAVTDTRDNFWLANSSTGKAFILLEATEVKEVKWSNDSRYLALRTADKVYIYQMNCKK